MMKPALNGAESVATAGNLNNFASQQLREGLVKRSMPLKTLAIVAVLLIATACSTSEDPSNPSPIASVAAIQPEATSTQPPTSTTTPSVVPLPTAVVTPTTTPSIPMPTPTTTPIPARVLPTLTPLPIATPLPTGTIPQITTEPAFPGLHFATFGDNTVLLTYPPDGTNRVAVVEQEGLVKIFENSASVSQVSTFLDIRSQVARNGDEEGLLGLVFHPNHVMNGYFYVYYSSSNPRRSVISRFTTSSGDRNRADPTSELKILEIPQPNSNHNGGMIEFGPDGYLYIALGDGGSSGDPYRNGQNPSTLLGSILRIDVDNPSDSDNLNYSIPPDNPFANSPGNERHEIWAYGLRNPWRFSFDRGSGDLWVGDVGQNTWEEVDVVVKGGNYGWNTLEGSHCFSPASGCDSADTILPVVEHTNGGGNCSVTGGYVYRGPSIPELTGVYIYSDFCSGTLWGIRSNDREAGAQVIGGGIQWVASFGEDEMGNLYMLGFGSPIRRITLSN